MLNPTIYYAMYVQNSASHEINRPMLGILWLSICSL